MRTILAVGAHPDDVELGCGGTLALHKTKGDRVYLLVLTRGEASGAAKIREKECKMAAQILGLDQLFFGGLEDTKVHDGRRTIDTIERIIDKVSCDIVYGPTPKDTHQDHRNTGNATLSASRRCKIVLLYEGASTQRNFIPQVFVNIEKTLEVKRKATLVFGSQLNNHHSGYLAAVEGIEGLARYRGYQAGVKVAEAFEVGKFVFEV